MSQGLSDYLIAALLNHVFGSSTMTKPATLSIHLYTGDPHAAGPEVSDTVDDTNYAPQSISFADEGVTEPGKAHMDATVVFDPVAYGSGGAPYSVTHWAVKDGGGNLLVAAPFPAAVERLAGEPLAINSGALFVALTREDS